MRLTCGFYSCVLFLFVCSFCSRVLLMRLACAFYSRVLLVHATIDRDVQRMRLLRVWVLLACRVCPTRCLLAGLLLSHCLRACLVWTHSYNNNTNFFFFLNNTNENINNNNNNNNNHHHHHNNNNNNLNFFVPFLSIQDRAHGPFQDRYIHTINPETTAHSENSRTHIT